MIVYSLLTTTVLLAFLSFLILWRSGKWKFKDSLHNIVLSLSLAIFIYLYGAWVFLSVYVKYVFAIGYFIILIIALLRKKENRPKLKWQYIMLSLPFSILLNILSILYFTGTVTDSYKTANLALPLKGDHYFVFQGGNGLPTNVFHYSLRGAVFAMDIIKLYDNGNRAKHIFSKQLDDYAIFADTLYSPCDAIIARTQNNNPDNIPPNRKRGPTNTNQVLLETDSFYVFMGHLKYGSVMVKPGQQVKQGQPLALVGNSGFSIEPHLHIQVHEKKYNDLPWYMQPQMRIAFDGKCYLLFEQIKPAHE